MATPRLVIEKTNDLPTVLPGATYTSTVTVRNTGSVPARNMLLSDTVAASVDGTTLEPQSAQLNDAACVYDEAMGVVAAATALTIPPGEAAVFTLLTRVPVGTAVGRFCNIGRFESENARSGEAEACIQVPAFAGLQNQFVDAPDPVGAGADVLYTSTLLNEARSNEAATENTLIYTYGVRTGLAGTFDITATRVYLNETPLINTETGAIISVPESGTELAAKEDYTLSTSQPGAQNLTINRPLPPGAVIFVVHEVAVLQEAEAGEYTSSFQWTAVGAGSGTEYQNTGTEPTTVVVQ